MKYAIVRRADIGGKLYFPGDFVTNPDRADLLVSRGFIVPAEAPAPTLPQSDLTTGELRARAKELGISSVGKTRVELIALVASEEARQSEQTPETPPSDKSVQEQAPSGTSTAEPAPSTSEETPPKKKTASSTSTEGDA